MCMKRLQEIATKCRSSPCLILLFLCIVPVGFTIFSILHIEDIWDNLSFVPLFDNQALFLPGPSGTFAAEAIIPMSVVPLLLFIIFIVECCH